MPKGMLARENGVLEGIRSHDFGAIVISLRIVSFEVGRFCVGQGDLISRLVELVFNNVGLFPLTLVVGI